MKIVLLPTGPELSNFCNVVVTYSRQEQQARTRTELQARLMGTRSPDGNHTTAVLPPTLNKIIHRRR